MVVHDQQLIVIIWLVFLDIFLIFPSITKWLFDWLIFSYGWFNHQPLVVIQCKSNQPRGLPWLLTKVVATIGTAAVTNMANSMLNGCWCRMVVDHHSNIGGTNNQHQLSVSMYPPKPHALSHIPGVDSPSMKNRSKWKSLDGDCKPVGFETAAAFCTNHFGMQSVYFFHLPVWSSSWLLLPFGSRTWWS